MFTEAIYLTGPHIAGFARTTILLLLLRLS